MSDIFAFAAELAASSEGRRLPPVHLWTPAYCGELDLVIRADGAWVHEGVVISRAPLVRLLSTVLRREGERYFLVTPVEKLGIQVEDAPFLAVLMRCDDSDAPRRRLVFTTNVGDDIVAGPDHVIEMRQRRADKAPYLHVRDGLWARASRAVYYDLVALGERRMSDGEDHFGVVSDGVFFTLGLAAEIF